MTERPMIDLEPREFRRLPTYSRRGLLIVLGWGVFLLGLMMASAGWPWLLLAQLGVPVFIITASLVLLTSHLE